MTPSVKIPGDGDDESSRAENALNVKLGLKCASLLEHLIRTQVSDENSPKFKKANISAAYMAALSLPYLDVKAELFYETDATGSILAYE